MSISLPSEQFEAQLPDVAPMTVASLQGELEDRDPELLPGTAAHSIGLLLLAARSVGQNIDKLARLTGMSRELVARCARRLVDNGVWRDGHTIYRWVDDPADVEALRSDVAVAEGKLCRRIDELGEMEWAPHGYWRKQFEYVSARVGEQPPEVVYLAHVEIPPQELPYYAPEEEVDADLEDAEASSDGAEIHRTYAEERPLAAALVPDGVAPLWIGGEPALPDTSQDWSGGTSTELFPEAVWLG